LLLGGFEDKDKTEPMESYFDLPNTLYSNYLQGWTLDTTEVVDNEEHAPKVVATIDNYGSSMLVFGRDAIAPSLNSAKGTEGSIHFLNTHPVATNVGNFVKAIGPGLHVIHSQGAVPATGMDRVNRVLYKAQQDYFGWASRTAQDNQGAHRPAAPTFDKIIDMVLSFRVYSLSELPTQWYDMLEVPPSRTDQANQDRMPRQQAASTAVFNPHADRAVPKRFRESEFTNISNMMEGKDVTIPKHSNKDVCLVWALKGECLAGCKRKGQHVRFSQPPTVRSQARRLSTLDSCTHEVSCQPLACHRSCP
jgi:hypothetical protein